MVINIFILLLELDILASLKQSESVINLQKYNFVENYFAAEMKIETYTCHIITLQEK